MTPAAVPRPRWEVADVIRHNGEAFLRTHGGHLTGTQKRALRDLARCRTAALGRHVEECLDCGVSRIAYNSCRNRHCPKCQGSAARVWLAERQADLLPAPYFHVVFTLPAQLAAIAFQNKAVVYDLLFKAAARDDRMHVRVVVQVLPPRVQYQQHADLGAETLGVGRDVS